MEMTPDNLRDKPHQEDSGLPLQWADFTISAMEKRDEEDLVNLLRRNLAPFEEAGSVLAATYRRLEKLYAGYQEEGSLLLVVKEKKSQKPIGCIGLGPLAGLPVSEGVGEIRDLVIDQRYRLMGLGTKLLRLVIEEATKRKFRHLYLETTPEMEKARALFRRFGFRPVLDQQKKGKDLADTLPCYFMLDNLAVAAPQNAN